MDFKWVVDALRRGLKVTRKSWAGDPPMYLYLVKDKSTHQKHIMCYTGTSHDFEWFPPTDLMLDADDWEEYVEPKKGIQLRSVTGETIKVTREEIPVWPEVNADGYARKSKDSDVIIHDGVYRYKKAPSGKAAEDTPELSAADKIRVKLLAELFIQLLRKDLFYPDEPHSKEPDHV